MKRKEFLKYSASSFFIPSMFNGFSVQNVPKRWLDLINESKVDTDKVLVLVRLDGGNDGLNTVIPLDQYANLSAARPKVIIDENKVLKLNGSDTVGLHPAMPEMQALYNEDKLQIIQSVGYPNPDFSHFRSTDIWMTGADSDQFLGTGWAGRYLHNEFPNFPVGFPNEDMPDPLSIEIGSLLSLTFNGPSNAMGLSVTDPSDFFRLIDGDIGTVPATPAGDKLAYVRLVKQQSNAYGEIMKNAYDSISTQSAYPDDNSLAQQLKIVSRLIAGGLKTRIYMVSIGGFDTHSNQVDTSNHELGTHAYLLSQVSEAIDAFMKDLEFLGTKDRVTGMTFSEFGRRIISNYSDGTDHGSAAPLFVFGHNIHGGILGDNPIIPANATEDDNLPMQYDFRSIYATMLTDWFCLPSDETDAVLLNSFPTLPIIKTSECINTSVRENLQGAGISLVKAYPNPFVQQTTISFFSDGGLCMIQIFNTHGQLVATSTNKQYPEGEHHLSWDSESLPVGTYHIRLQNGVLQQVRRVVKVK